MKMFKNTIKYGLLALIPAIFFFGGLTQVALAAYCPFSPASNRTIVTFDAGLIWGKGTERTYNIKSVNLPAGKYRVSLSASDSYADRVNTSQPNESYYVELRNSSGVVARTSATPDLRDNVVTANYAGVVSTINVDERVNTVVARHANYLGVMSSANSVTAGCAAFDLISTPTPTPVSLTGSCSTNPSAVDIGDSVNWRATASGGTGHYTYSWSGTDGLYGNSSSVSKTYSSAGVKYGTVTITSGSQSITRSCSATVNQAPVNNLTGSCSVNPSSVSVNGYLNWSATASGGTGSYTYSWSGTDGLYGNSSSVSRTYQTAGTKTGTVTITSGSQSVTRTCSAAVTEIVSGLSVSCSVDDSSVDVDEDVTYTANVSGGSGSYSYDWTGSESLRGSSRNVTWSYDDDGTKNATVTVTSGSQSATASCSVRVREEEEDDDDDLRVRCYANPTNPQVGQQMNWYADVSGGSGSYRYSWDGSDDLDSSSRSPSMTYYSGGRKNATVEVRSGGQTDSATCYANVNQNTVLAFSQSNPVPLASAVYLSQVPYTGLADNLKLVWFILGLILFSAYVTYVIISYKKSIGELS